VRDPTTLPPWECRTEREKREFTEWSIAELILLDQRLHPDDHQQSDYVVPAEVYRRHRQKQKLDRAKAAACDGDLGPLRALYPEIAEFIHEPKRPRGQRRSYRKPGVNVWEKIGAERPDAAVESVRHLREIWRRHYGRWKRRYDDHPTAEEIAAAFHDCSVDEITQAAARRHRQRYRRQRRMSSRRALESR
jgi:hypothetical protein